MRVKLAYVMSRFPFLPETFILREMSAVSALGWEIALYPLIIQKDTVVHGGVEEWMGRVRRVPWISRGVLFSNLSCLASRPGRYLSLLARVVLGNLSSPTFLVRAILLFPRAVAMAERMRTEGIGHIHAHYATHPALVAWIIHHLTGISYSVTVHAHDIFVERAMLATKLRDAAFVVAISEFNRRFLATHVGEWIVGKTRVVHCGIDPAMYAPREERPLRGRPLELLSIGSLQPYKGMSHLVEAIALLSARGVQVRCRIVGEGVERPRLEALIAARHVESAVELVGAKTQTEVAQLLATADCYVQPSVVTHTGKMEGIPVALMEALASGLPVIASDLSGIPELIVPGKGGYLVPQADALALADAIEGVFRNPSEAAGRAKAGRAHVLEEFNLQASAARLSSLFEKHAAR